MSTRRRKSNDGVLGSHDCLLPLRPGLIAAVLGSEYGKPAARRELRIFHGKHPVQAHNRAKHPDNVILEVRRLKEQESMQPARIVDHLTELGVTIGKQDVIRILSYYTRAHLVPTEGATPYVVAAEVCA